MNRVALAICLFLATNAFAADPSYCFAFMRKGDVFISCDGREDRITQRGKSNSFAIAEEPGFFAVLRTPSDAVIMTNYKSGEFHPVRGSVRRLVSTCGGLFAVAESGQPPLMRDLITGTDVAIDPYTWFRCSSDRKVIAGIMEHDRALYEGIPPREIAPPGRAAYYEFNISPNGKYLAYASDRQPLCVWSSEGGSQCARSADALDNTHDLVSVRDDGEVLVSMPTMDMCVFKSPMEFSPAKPGDKKAVNCLAIGHWRPGMNSPEVVEPLGRTPQWISPETAALLRLGVRKTYFGYM